MNCWTFKFLLLVVICDFLNLQTTWLFRNKYFNIDLLVFFQRLDALTATNIVHVYLWGWPEKANKKLKPFLLNLINEVKKDELKEKRMNAECCLKKAFLERLNTDDLFDAALFVSPHHSFAVDLRKVILQFPNSIGLLLASEWALQKAPHSISIYL